MFASRDWARLGSYVASVLDEIGYDGSLRVFTNSETYFDAILQRRYQAAMSGWIGDTGPANFLR